MKAEPTFLVGKVISPEGTLFRIPVYQRKYSWEKEQCQILLDDIEKILMSGKASRTHFLGTMVYVESDENSYLLDNEYIVIDGQQRLTTIIIFLKALQNCAKNSIDEHDISGVIDGILYNHNKETAKHFRIKLKAYGEEYNKFIYLLEDKLDQLKDSDRIFQNHQTCLRRIIKWIDSGFALNKILWAVKQLEIVKIVMGKDDNQQAIFESLNSTGLNLSRADLIRNFLFMNESPDQQEKLYSQWEVIERNLKDGQSDEEIDNFFAHYIIFINNSPKGVYKKTLYRSFVELFEERNITRLDTLAELERLSGIYRAFINKDSNKKYPAEVMKYLEDLRTLKQTTCYPFLLHVFDDYENEIIDADTLTKVVKLVFCYIMRRRVCGLESNALAKIFASLYSRIFNKIPENKQKYYQAINKFISTRLSKDAMPKDSDFENALINGNIYSQILCKFLLLEIENYHSKEIVKADNLTIEHIMPQNLSLEWRRVISSEDHDKYLHTLGNLTLTGYNPELSDKSFSEKVKLIQEKPSRIITLNSDVTNKDSWTVEDITERAKRLAEIVMEIYSVEKINDTDLMFEPLEKITLDDDPNRVTNKDLDSFVFDGEEYEQNSFASMLVDVVKILDDLKPDILVQLAQENYTFKSGEKAYIKYAPDSMNSPKKIRDNIFIGTGLPSESIMRFIDSLFECYDIDKSRFYIFLKAGN